MGHPHLLVLGDSRSGKSTLLRTIAAGLQDRYTSDEITIAVIDVRGHIPDMIPRYDVGCGSRQRQWRDRS
ncbi:FtsK/SpoIIIE domain-containing protein [Cellulomonas sp.]|uniref:FtsK/SpoIIIE domain-containing protein n=1 Tax=Cellulomonas sp. TaxID=40001 RepID=UPI003BABD037